MKKISVVLLSMLLLFSVTQAAFALPNYVGVEIGGSKFSGTGEKLNFVAGANLNYNLSPKFSISGKGFFERYAADNAYAIRGQVDTKFKILELLMINAGLSVGTNLEHHSLSTDGLAMGITAGVFVDANIIGSLSVYGDAKIVLADILPNPDWMPKVDDKVQFIGSVGLMYKVLPMLGIKGEVGYQGGSTFFTVGAGLVF